MTADDAFLAAIIAAPADDLPRLVYADYLDEHGDPDRAEFIRLQIASHGEWKAPARADELLRANKDRWKIPGVAGGQFFRRGFVGRLEILTAEFLAHADRIGRAAPVTSVRLSLARDYVPEVVRVPWLSRLDELDLSGNFGVGSWLDDLLAAVSLPNLRALDLGNNNLLPNAVRVVAARAANYPHLTRLDLSGNFVSDEGMAVLADSPALAGLTELVARCSMVQEESSIHPAGVAALAASRHLTRLRVLDLAGHYIGNDGLAELARSPLAATLEDLDVMNNEIGTPDDGGVEAITASPHFGRLKVLILGEKNALGRRGAEALARWPRLETIDVVDLTRATFTDGARETLLASPFADRFVLEDPTRIA